MNVDVLLFGPAAKAAGADRLQVSTGAAPAPTAGDVLLALHASCPALAPFLAGARLAINHSFARESDPIRPGDEVALIALVGGG